MRGLDCHGDCAWFPPTRRISPTRSVRLHGHDGQRPLDPFSSIARPDGVQRRTSMKFNRQGQLIESLIGHQYQSMLRAEKRRSACFSWVRRFSTRTNSS